MRDIRFRAWFPGPNVMGKVTNLKGSNTDYLFDGVVAECFIGGKQVFYEAYKNFVLMEYTGLKDRHGKEIYEGDILRLDDGDVSHHKIYWEYKEGRWFDERLEDGDSQTAYDSFAFVTECKVIGNIYETPELLKP